MLIKPEHLRKANYCISGAKSFFKDHDLDWRQFIKTGLDESEFLKTNDYMAIRLVEIANGR